jgi:hypothetical protein
MDKRNAQSRVVSRRSETSLSSKLSLFLALFALLFFSAFAFAQAEPCTAAGSINTFGLNCVFYGGNFDPNNANANALANENDAIVNGNPYGAETIQNFNWSGGTIQGLFTNNLSALNPTSGYWEIRQGLSEGNPGTLIASGTGGGTDFRHTPTGNSAFGYDEFTDAVKTSVTIGPGKYWFSVVPNDLNNANRSFNTNTFVSGGAIGSDTDNEQYFDSAFFGVSFTNANNEGVFQDFSSGVIGGSVPEPSSLIMLGSGVLGLGGLLRRKLLA